jgi:hypothetical protein
VAIYGVEASQYTLAVTSAQCPNQVEYVTTLIDSGQTITVMCSSRGADGKDYIVYEIKKLDGAYERRKAIFDKFAWQYQTLSGYAGVVRNMAVDSAGSLHIICLTQSCYFCFAPRFDMYYQVLTGDTWSSPVLVDSAVSKEGCPLAVDANDRLHLAYTKMIQYQGQFYTAWRPDRVKYKVCENGTWNSVWGESTTSGLGVSMALMNQYLPSIAYNTVYAYTYCPPSGSCYGIWYETATRVSRYYEGTWLTQDVQNVSAVSTVTDHFADGTIAIVYDTSGGIRFAKVPPDTIPVPEIVDAQGHNPVMMIDGNDVVHMYYNDAENNLKYATYDNVSWDVGSVQEDEQTIQGTPRFAFPDAMGRPSFVFDTTMGELKWASK